MHRDILHERLKIGAARGKVSFAVDFDENAELASGVYAARVARDADAARANGVTGTPAFFVNGERHEESFDARSLVEALTSNPATAY